MNVRVALKTGIFKRIKYKVLICLIFGLTFFIGLANASYTLVSIDPPVQTVLPEETFTVDVYCTPTQSIKAYEFKLEFDPTLLQANSVTEGDIFEGFQTYFNAGTIDNVEGTIVNVYGLIIGQDNTSDPGTLATISFSAKTNSATSILYLYDVGVTNETQYVTVTKDDGNITIYNENMPIVFSEVTPSNKSTNMQVSTSSLSINIEDPQGDAFDWFISTSPDAGSASGSAEYNGTKSCSISNLDYATTYTWYVSCKDSSDGSWTNASYWFKTKSQENQGGGGGSSGGGGDVIPPVEVENIPPAKPETPTGPSLIERGVLYEYSSYSYDSDDEQIKLLFDWGDGTYSSWSEFVSSNITVSMTHSYDTISNFNIKVIAQDENGTNSSWSESLVVSVSETETDQQEPPELNISSPENISSNQTVTFDASESFDPNGAIVSYLWDFGDGETGTGINVTHTYKTPGDYVVTLLVIDNEGNTYNTSMSVNVLTGAAQKTASEKTTQSLPIFNYILIGVIAILIVVLVIVFKNKIIIFALSSYLRRHQPKGVHETKTSVTKSIVKEKRQSYYSSVPDKPFTVKREVHPKEYKEYYPKKKAEIFEEPEPFDEYDELSIGEKVDIIVGIALRPEKQTSYAPDKIIKEEITIDEDEEFKVGDKIDKLVDVMLRPTKESEYILDDTLEDIEKNIDDLAFLKMKKRINNF